MMKQFDHMIERKLNPRLKFLAGCGQFSDFSNKTRSYYRKESAASPPRDQRQHAE
jgi:hypothetical protein